MKKESLKGNPNTQNNHFYYLLLIFFYFLLFFLDVSFVCNNNIFFWYNYHDNYQRPKGTYTKATTATAEKAMNYFSHNKINHENSYLNVPDYYRCNNDDAAIVDVIDKDLIDKNNNIAKSNNQTEQINGNNNDCHYRKHFVKIKCDESTFSRCILLVLGSICQQGKRKRREKQQKNRHTYNEKGIEKKKNNYYYYATTNARIQTIA